jgi:hypothetical protein
MISSGESMFSIAKKLKERNANRVFVFSTFSLFCNGLEKFDKAYDEQDDTTEASEYLFDILTEDMTKYIPSEYSGATIVEQQTIEVLNKYGYVIGYAFKVKLSNGEETYLRNTNF